MKEFFVQQCAEHENKNITASFVVASKQVKPKKSGEPYLALTLADRTGSIEAKMWDGVPEAMGTFEQDDVIKVRGLINKYNGRFQLTIHKIRRMDESEVEYADYLPKTSKDVEQQIQEALYYDHLQPALRSYLTKLREDAYIDVKTGFVDTGASPNQTKPIIMAAASSPEEQAQKKAKKKKKLLIF